MLKIRLMRKSDLSELAKIYIEVYQVFDVGEKWNKETAYNLITFWFKSQPDLCFVAEYNNKIVGAFTATVKPWWDGKHLIIEEIFVSPRYQKCGIGSALAKKCSKRRLRNTM